MELVRRAACADGVGDWACGEADSASERASAGKDHHAALPLPHNLTAALHRGSTGATLALSAYGRVPGDLHSAPVVLLG